jgi:UDP-N-acetylmuramate--alanine ligase
MLKKEFKGGIYFIGAGGIGMSALVQYFLAKGRKVAGYDRVESALTQELNREGASIHYEDNIDLIPEEFKDPEHTLVVLTPAVPDDHSELNYFRSRGFTIMKRARLLGEITKTERAIAVAGTHGKTTTSSMIAHLLKQSSVDCNAFLGGILKNYDSNLLLSAKSDLTVIEADEYDRSFHWLRPYMAVITSVAPDHLDIYGSEAAYKEAFSHFTSLINPGGALLLEQSAELEVRNNQVTVYRYGIKKNKDLDFYADDIKVDNGEISFTFATPSSVIENVKLGVPVEINVVNAVAAMAIGWLNGMTDEELRRGMATFAGPKRRFDFHIKSDKLVLIDDYAHHPEELEASIRSVKQLYPGRRLTVVFQPHLYSRTQDFYREFAAALSLAHQVILIPIYPAREEPMPGIDSGMILSEITIADKRLLSKEELLNEIKQIAPDVLLIAGAGDIELLVEPIKQQLDD